MNSIKENLKVFYTHKDKMALKSWDGLIIALPPKYVFKTLSKYYPEPIAKRLNQFIQSRKFKAKAKAKLFFDLNSRQRVAIVCFPQNTAAFNLLEFAREVITHFHHSKTKKLLVDLSLIEQDEARCVDALTAACVAHNYIAPKYKKEKKKKKIYQLELSFKIQSAKIAQLRKVHEETSSSSELTNLVRHLTQRAGNDLSTTSYVKEASALAESAGLKTEFFNLTKLKQLNAGAFLAVAQGSHDRNGGILKLSYTSSKSKKTIAFVGKGITFDTGGNNLKTGGHMHGMHGDMAGSAVALALVLLAAKQKWPVNVVTYMAITDNVLSATAYRPNDIITSLNGKTIEVIDTDAEGRMVLADTLALASQSKPNLIVDFATLTGSVIRAIGNNYCGGYSNRKKILPLIRKAGYLSGERVWPFPNDADYGRCLKSDIADIKQCRLTGGVDHIEASYFLSQFVDKKISWVHIDLAAMEPDEALAHIPSKPTGFGLRFTKELIRLIRM